MNPAATDRAGMRRAGFSLVELLIVVAIISALAAIAIPSFARFHYRAKASEGMTSLAGLRTAEEAYMAEHGTYFATIPVPGVIPGNLAEVWPAGTPFDTLGWRPDGRVYYQYLVSADDPGGSGALARFTAEAASDIDANGQPNFWALVKPLPGAASGIAGMLPGSTCAGTGTYNATTAAKDLLDVVGPCDNKSGRSEF